MIDPKIETDGFTILKNSLSRQTIFSLQATLDNFSQSLNSSLRKDIYGVRNLLNVLPQLREFAESGEVRQIIEKHLGKSAKVVRAIYFDKTPNANWKVPWHQDLTVSVFQKIETKGFTAWTKKADIQHVQPPIEILERMLTLRFHLDDADETNGALKVLPKTHKFGRLSATEIQNLKSNNEAVLCKAKAGDCLLMKPLLLHSSSAGNLPRHRRVIHLEFAAEDLPKGLNWYGS